MTLYSVKDWNAKYENNRTRELKRLDWIPIPTKQDGDGYTELVSQSEGAAMYGCWVAILQVASKCKPRGVLIRETAEPHTAQSLSRMSHMPSGLVGKTLIVLVRIRWLDAVPYEVPIEIPQDDAGKPQASAVASVPFPSVPFSEEGGSGETKPELNELPAHLNTARVQNKWKVWMNCRRAFKKPGNWVELFNGQIEWLGQFTEPEAFETLSASIRNGWQGLFEPKGNNANNGTINGKPRVKPDYTKGF